MQVQGGHQARKRIDRSRAFTSLVRLPTEIRSTPVSATARMGVEADIAGSLEDRPAAGTAGRFPQEVEVEVVEQDHGGAGGEGGVELFQVFHPDLDEFAAIAGPVGGQFRFLQRFGQCLRRRGYGSP